MKYDIDINATLQRESQTLIDNAIGKADIDFFFTNADFLANESGFIPDELRDDFLEYASIGRREGEYLNDALDKADFQQGTEVHAKGDMENFSAYVNVIAYAACGSTPAESARRLLDDKFRTVRVDRYGEWKRGVFKFANGYDDSVFYLFRRDRDETFSMIVVSEYRDIELSFH